MNERERENAWHSQFYGLQRKGLPVNLAAAISTKKFGPHSDKMRTPADHNKSYSHLVRSHYRQTKHGTTTVNSHVRRR
jgi:hypothetical protein